MIIIAAAGFLSVILQNRFADNIIKLISDSQMESIKLAAGGISTRGQLNTLCNELALNAEGNEYWFVYSDTRVLLERDVNETERLLGINYKNLPDYFIRKGGSGINEFFTRIDSKTPFTAIVSKDKSIGDEIISVRFITVENSVYCIGKSITKAFVFSSVNFEQYSIRNRILLGTIIIMTMGASVISLIYYNKHDYLREKYKNDITEKNRKIQQLYDSINPEATMLLSKTTDITGVFNRDFLDAVIGQIYESKGSNRISLLLIRLCGYDEMCYAQSPETAKLIAKTTAGIISVSCDESDIAARFSNDIFMIMTMYNDAEFIKNNILRQLTAAIPSVEVITSVRHIKAANIKRAVIDALKELQA